MASNIKELRGQSIARSQVLDKVVFDELGLSEDERKEVYWGHCRVGKTTSG